EKGSALAKELGENAIFVKQDVTNENDWKNVIDETEKKFGPVDVLVNNAGITMSKSIEDTTLDDYNKIVQINQVSVFLGMKSVCPSMKKAGSGIIINNSSINGIVGRAIAFTDTKFSVRAMTKAAALEYSAHGIRENSVPPGVIETPMFIQEDVE